MKRKISPGRFVPYLSFLVLLIGIVAGAAVQTITWVHSGGWTRDDGTTGTYTESEMAAMTYYLRIENPVYSPGSSGDGYIGETKGTKQLDVDIVQAMKNRGMVVNPGDNLAITVTAAFPDIDGNVYESSKSDPGYFQVPFPPGRVPVPPSAPNF